ncbi:hypothetical protein ABNF97_24890 [Plantactinospora sp. B6F1]|uniref:hypothetical protein n=1 Tax=Plantactinospora sp. B6F1 TaxID=3158971 RepID=UPI0013EF313B
MNPPLSQVVAGVPVMVGVLPDVAAGVQRVAERLVVGSVPEIVGRVPMVVRQVSHGDYPGSLAPRILMHQPVRPPPAYPVTALPVPAERTTPVPILAEPPGPAAPLWQLLHHGAGNAAGASRTSGPRAVARSLNSGSPSTPHPPFDNGAGTQQAGPVSFTGGPAAALPATVGWQPSARSLSVLAYGDARPTGRSPGVPALPG